MFKWFLLKLFYQEKLLNVIYRNHIYKSSGGALIFNQVVLGLIPQPLFLFKPNFIIISFWLQCHSFIYDMSIINLISNYFQTIWSKYKIRYYSWWILHKSKQAFLLETPRIRLGFLVMFKFKSMTLSNINHKYLLFIYQSKELGLKVTINLFLLICLA